MPLSTKAAAFQMVCFRSVTKTSVHVLLLLLKILICRNGCRGKAVVVPPADQRDNGGDTGGHQLFHSLALDGQHGLAQCRQHLIGQGQQKAGSAGNGACGDGGRK